ncbi:MAG: class I SAM-dependent methyltransferase [Chitinophagales bacterium]|nr:class I SAM-dependent methyltransferase [Chitinophagales bacterium]
MKEYFEANRKLWNERTPVHEKSAFYNMQEFKSGVNSLMPIELAEVGSVTGKKLLHLQCHFGLDTLSWHRLGAIVTGVDFSEVAIETARKLAAEVHAEAAFICSNVYDLDQHLQETFDIVFTSYGVIGWLPDLDKWAAVIARSLRTGGVFYIAEFHPVVWMFDNDFEKIKYAYHNTSVIKEEESGTYADPGAGIRTTSYTWNHGLGEVVTALVSHGLQIEFLHEFPFSPYNCFQKTVKGADGNYRIKHLENLLPLMYSIRATKL